MFLNLSIVGNNSTKTLGVTFMVVICTAITIGVTPKPYSTNYVFNSGNISSNVNFPYVHFLVWILTSIVPASTKPQ